MKLYDRSFLVSSESNNQNIDTKFTNNNKSFHHNSFIVKNSRNNS